MKKATLKHGRIISPHNIAERMRRSMGMPTGDNTWLDVVLDDFTDMASDTIDNHILVRQRRLLVRSVIAIEERWKLAVENGTATKAMAKRNIDRLSKDSITESYRQAYLTHQLEHAHDTTVSTPMAMMLSTTADEPDDEHALLEGEVLPKEEVLAHLQRFGCRHTYKDISISYSIA